MRIFFLLVLVLNAEIDYGQTTQTKEVPYTLTLAYHPATISLLSGNDPVTTIIVNTTQKVIFTDLKSGTYRISVAGLGQQTLIRDTIVITASQKLLLDCKIEGPCLYDHPAGYIPTCPEHHQDDIIPIVYGLIVSAGDKYVADIKDMKVKYAGCLTTGCDPQYYCKKHKIAF